MSQDWLCTVKSNYVGRMNRRPDLKDRLRRIEDSGLPFACRLGVGHNPVKDRRILSSTGLTADRLRKASSSSAASAPNALRASTPDASRRVRVALASQNRAQPGARESGSAARRCRVRRRGHQRRRGPRARPSSSTWISSSPGPPRRLTQFDGEAHQPALVEPDRGRRCRDSTHASGKRGIVDQSHISANRREHVVGRRFVGDAHAYGARRLTQLRPRSAERKR